ncbi:MAG: ammonium transporter [Nitrospira sp.]|nr:ammonium transporter [Nitrospira sp.]
MPETAPKVWLLIATALLMLTLPGVALFYGGMVRKKNVLNTMGLPVLALVLVSLLWLLGGDLFFVSPGAAGNDRSGTAVLLLLYQMMAGALALALIAGALVERVRVSFFLLLGLLWSLLVYRPVAQWLGSGWLADLGSLDYAGGAVIHISAGVSALVAAIVIGPRKGHGRIEMKPNNLPLSACGASLLLVGWCGFSAGTGVAAMTTATGAFVAIQAAAAAGALAWTVVEWLQRDKPTLLGTISGAVAGLVAASPAAGYVGPLAAIVIGIGAGGLCYMVVNFVKPILGYDDSLDVFGMHAVGGTWGMVATGLFASTAVNPDGSDGLFFGYPYQFFVQMVAVLTVWAYAGLLTMVLTKGLSLVLQPRVEGEEEIMGMDLAQHGERGYS